MKPASFLALLTVAALATPIRAADWRLDLLSYFRFVGAGQAQQIDGGLVPVQVGLGLLGTWSLRVRADDVKFEPIVVGPEEVLDLSLASDGAGELTVKNGQVHGYLTLALSIRRRGYGPAITMPLRLTTETATSFQRPNASIAGVPFDPSSGFFQLVAVAEEPWSRPPLIGNTFEVVLSGRLVGVPGNLTTATP